MKLVSSIVESGARIGEGTIVGYFCHIESTSRIGKNCEIRSRVMIGHDVYIGNNVKIGAGTTFADSLARPLPPRMDTGEKPTTVIEDDVKIGSNVTIVGNTKIKKGAIIGDGAVVLGTIPPGTFAAGNPARKIYSLSSIRESYEKVQ